MLSPRISKNDAIQFLAVFIILFIAAKFGQYLFFEWHTSPAVLWPPTGIALAAVWLGGYRYAVPVFVALFAASVTGPSAHLFPAVITTPLAQTLGHIAGAYFLRRVGFAGSFADLKSVAVFLLAITVCSMIAPTITTLISIATGNLSVSAYLSWSRSWSGYLFSSLILFPVIVAWVLPDRHIPRRKFAESAAVIMLLGASVYLLFWTQAAAQFSFLLFALFFAAHFWIGYRFSTRAVTLALLGTTVFGILGLFLAPAPDRPLNGQLFATELFLFLVAPIFYAFSALVKERATTIEELKEAMRRIETENSAKNEFIAVLAHELRNPLSPVKTTLEMLELQSLAPETAYFIKSAHQQVHAMRRLLDDLLDVTRVTQGKFQLQVERAQLAAMLERSYYSVRELMESRRHTLVAEPVDPSVWLDVDPVRFEQVMVNILNNAAKYTPEGGRIEVTNRIGAGVAQICVRDNGRGIRREHLESIFEPFWQEKNGMPRDAGGIGVGLSLTRHIIKMHRGALRAESGGEGAGSTFIIELPLPSADSETAVYQSPTQRTAVAPFRILIVDDNKAAADVLAALLSMKGHTVEKAYTGAAAIELAAQFRPEIILLDIGLPHMDGYAVARRLRGAGYAGRIAAVTGYGQEEDRERALQSGFDHHFTKPVAILRLEEYLASVREY